jgi:glycosyltransferase involved in cell wall biosynthesis
MRILEWAFPYQPIQGGRAILIQRMAENFSKLGHDVFLIGSGRDDRRPSEEEQFPFEILLLDIPNEKNFVPHSNFISNRRKIENSVKNFRPDIINLHNTNHLSVVYLLDLLQKMEIKPKIVCSIHDLESLRALTSQDKNSKSLLEITNNFICPSQFIYDEMIKSLGMYGAEDRIELILGGVPISSSKAQVASRNLFDCLIVANLERHKGAALVLAAWNLIHQKFPEAKLRIIGSGNDLDFLHFFRNSLCLQGSVIFEGWKNYEELQNIYSSSGLLFAASTIPEAFGLSVVEAQMCGVPVIASAIGAHLETVRDDQSGFLIPPGDIAAIVAATELFFSEGTQERMIQTAKIHASENFDFARTIHEYLSLFSRM